MTNRKQVVIVGGRLPGRATLHRLLASMDFSVCEERTLDHHKPVEFPEPRELQSMWGQRTKKPKKRRLKRKPGGKL